MALQAKGHQGITGYTIDKKGFGQAYYVIGKAPAPKPTGPPPITGRGVLVEKLALEVDAGALVRSVVVNVTAAAAGEVEVGSVATIRDGGPDVNGGATQLTVDFNGLRTISSLVDPATLSGEKGSTAAADTWVGSGFAGRPAPISLLGEVLTERLLISGLVADTEPSELEGWRVVLPTPPHSVEVKVNGVRAWSGLLGEQEGGPGATMINAVVDITASVAAAAQAGAVPVIVELTSQTPADLGLAVVDQDVLSRYQVGFPEGATRTLRAQAEGPISMDLPLDGIGSIETAEIRRLELTVNATVPDTRVEPAQGPPPSGDADVELTVDRSLLVRLPASMLGNFASLDAVRLGVVVIEDGELGGSVLAGSPANSGQPGDSIEGLVLGPQVVAAGTSGQDEVQWVTLAFSEPLELDGSDIWVSLTAARGRAALCLAPESTATWSTSVMWRAPSGFYRSLSIPAGIPPLVGSVRAVGTPADTTPVGSITFALRDRPDAQVVTDPPASGQRVVLDLGPSSVAASGGQLPLELLATTGGEFTVGQVDVFYSTKGSG